MPEDELEVLSRLADKMGDFAPSMRELLGYALAYKMFGDSGKKEESEWSKIIPLLLQQQQQSTNMVIALMTQQQQMMLQMMQLLLGHSKGGDWEKIMAMQQNMMNTILQSIQNMQTQYNQLLIETEKKERKREMEDLKKTIDEIKKKFDEKIKDVMVELGRLQYMEDQYQRYKRGEPIEVALEQLRRYEEFRRKMMEYAEELGMKKVPTTPEGRIDWSKAGFELLKKGFSILEKYVEAQPRAVKEIPIQQPVQVQKPKAIVIPQQETTPVPEEKEETPAPSIEEKIEKVFEEEKESGTGEVSGESEEAPTTESTESEEGGSGEGSEQ